MTIFADISREIRILKKSQALEVIYSKAALAEGAPSLADGRQMIQEMFTLECASGVLQSLIINDELFAYWKSTRPYPETVVGEFFLRSVLVFAATNSLNEIYLSQNYDAVDLRATRVFDYCPYQGGPVYSLLPIIGKRIEDQVYIFNERDVYRTSLDYLSYLKVLRRTRGFLYWQYLFCEGIKPEEYELVAIRKGLDFVAKTFPKDDYADLRERLGR